MLKAVVESLESVDESLHQFYGNQDGKFVLKVERVDGFGLANTEKLEGALRKERKALADAAKIIGRIPEGKSIDDLLESATKLSELGDLSELESLDEKLKERTSQLQAKFDADRKRIEEKFTGDLTAKARELESLTGQLDDQIARGVALKAISDRDGIPELLLPAVLSSIKVVTSDDGKRVARVLGSDGQPRLSTRAGSGEEMTIPELIDEMQSSTTFAPAFKGTAAGGGGTDKPGGGRSGNVHRITMSDARDPAKYQAARASAAKAGVPLEMTE
jgi:hypothetical protein